MTDGLVRESPPAPLLALWGFPPDADIAPIARQGTNNQTFLVRDGQRRYVLRVSGFLSAGEVRAEHRILARLRQAGGLPLRVPEPVAAPDGRTVIETRDGPATVCRWLPGVRPAMIGRTDFERFGRATGLLSTALAQVPPGDTVRDWRGDPRRIQPDDPPVGALCGELRAAGLSTQHADLLVAADRRIGQGWPAVAALPAQAIHGDLAASNLLADPDTGEVTAVLDFELAGAGFRVQEVLFALYQSGALDGPDWPHRTAAFLRGCASVRHLEPAEVAVLPDLLVARALGSVLWRVGRWHAGLGDFSEVIGHARRLEAATEWLTVNEDALVSVATASNESAACP